MAVGWARRPRSPALLSSPSPPPAPAGGWPAVTGVPWQGVRREGRTRARVPRSSASPWMRGNGPGGGGGGRERREGPAGTARRQDGPPSCRRASGTVYLKVASGQRPPRSRAGSQGRCCGPGSPREAPLRPGPGLRRASPPPPPAPPAGTVCVSFSPVSLGERRSPSPAGSHGRGGGQTRRAAVHQRSGGAGERRHPGLLQDVCVGPVGCHGGDSRPDRPARLHLLLPGFRPPLCALGVKSRTAMEQVL